MFCLLDYKQLKATLSLFTLWILKIIQTAAYKEMWFQSHRYTIHVHKMPNCYWLRELLFIVRSIQNKHILSRYFALLFCIFGLPFCVFCVFAFCCVLFLLLYTVVSFLLVYKFTDHYHWVETQLKLINTISITILFFY